jgi:SHS2 domain-containing protein
MSPFESFEHTADVGLRVWADRLDDLFAEAGRGFLSLLVENAESVVEAQETRITVEADRAEDLLLDWLTELLYRFETDHLLLAGFDVKLCDHRLEARCRGETLDWKRHRLQNEIKAVTYHNLRVEQRDGGWLAEVIFDI